MVEAEVAALGPPMSESMTVEPFDILLMDFAVAEAIWPELSEPSLLIAKTYLRIGKATKAERIFTKLRTREDSRDGLAFDIATVYHSLENWEK